MLAQFSRNRSEALAPLLHSPPIRMQHASVSSNQHAVSSTLIQLARSVLVLSWLHKHLSSLNIKHVFKQTDLDEIWMVNQFFCILMNAVSIFLALHVILSTHMAMGMHDIEIWRSTFSWFYLMFSVLEKRLQCLCVLKIVRMNYGRRLILGGAVIFIYTYKKWKTSGRS